MQDPGFLPGIEKKHEIKTGRREGKEEKENKKEEEVGEDPSQRPAKHWYGLFQNPPCSDVVSALNLAHMTPDQVSHRSLVLISYHILCVQFIPYSSSTVFEPTVSTSKGQQLNIDTMFSQPPCPGVLFHKS